MFLQTTVGFTWMGPHQQLVVLFTLVLKLLQISLRHWLAAQGLWMQCCKLVETEVEKQTQRSLYYLASSTPDRKNFWLLGWGITHHFRPRWILYIAKNRVENSFTISQQSQAICVRLSKRNTGFMQPQSVGDGVYLGSLTSPQLGIVLIITDSHHWGIVQKVCSSRD